MYTIRTNVPTDTVKELLHAQLRAWGYSEDDLWDYSIGGSVYEDNGTVVVDYCPMCNVNEDLCSFFEKIFGEENVDASY